MWPFSKKSNEAKIKFTGKPVHINPDPRSREAMDRNVARINVCRKKLKELQKGTPEYQSFKKELVKRLLIQKMWEAE